MGVGEGLVALYARRLRSGLASKLLHIRASKSVSQRPCPSVLIQFDVAEDGFEKCSASCVDQNFEVMREWVDTGEMTNPKLPELRKAFKILDHDN